MISRRSKPGAEDSDSPSLHQPVGAADAAAPSGGDTLHRVLSDEEIARQLHRELNAAPSLLRARSRRAPEFFNAAAAEPKPRDPRPAQASDAAPPNDKKGGEGNEGKKAQKRPAEEVATGDKKAGSGAKAQLGKKAKIEPEAAQGHGDPSVEQLEAEGMSAAAAAKRRTAAAATEVKQEPKPEPPAPALKPKAQRKQPAQQQEGSDVTPRAGGSKSMAAKKAGVAAGGKNAARYRKLPKLPMVRQGRRWYRCRVVDESGDKVTVEFAGFEDTMPNATLPRDSDRIWRGSMKGKDWRYLGDGAWEPKQQGSSGGSDGSGAKKARTGGSPAKEEEHGEGEHDHLPHFQQEEESESEEPGQRDSEELAQRDDEQPAQRDDEHLAQCEDKQEGQSTAPAAACVAAAAESRQTELVGKTKAKPSRKRPVRELAAPAPAQAAEANSLPVEVQEQGETQELQLQQQEEQQQQQRGPAQKKPEKKRERKQKQKQEQQAEGGNSAEEARQPPPKKQRVRNRKKKMEQPTEESQAQTAGATAAPPPFVPPVAATLSGDATAGPSGRPDGADTPAAEGTWRAAWKERQLAAVLGGVVAPAQPAADVAGLAVPDAMAAALAGLGGPTITPTPETPLTRLSSRPSTTPSLQPLSLAAKVRAAQGGSGGKEGYPLSPRAGSGSGGARRGGSADPSASLPVSPRGGRREVSDEQRPAGGRRRRARQASGSGSESEGYVAGGEGGVSEGSDEPPRVRLPRPRRAARKAAILRAEEYAVGDEGEEDGDDADNLVAVNYGPAWRMAPMPRHAMAVGEPLSPRSAAAAARRRRKPLVAAAAPTDVDPLRVEALEAAALAALAEMPSPRSTAAARAAAAAVEVEAVLAEEDAKEREAAAAGRGQVEEDDEEYAPPRSLTHHQHVHHRRRGGGGGHPKRGGHNSSHRYGRSFSAHAALEHPRSGGGGWGSGRRAFVRTHSDPAHSSLESLAAAQQAFAPILGALSSSGLGGAYAPAAELSGWWSSAAVAVAATVPASSAGASSAMRFSRFWGCGKPAQLNGFSHHHSSILAVKPELFGAAPASSLSLPSSSGGLHASQSLPLFC